MVYNGAVQTLLKNFHSGKWLSESVGATGLGQERSWGWGCLPCLTAVSKRYVFFANLLRRLIRASILAIIRLLCGCSVLCEIHDTLCNIALSMYALLFVCQWINLLSGKTLLVINVKCILGHTCVKIHCNWVYVHVQISIATRTIDFDRRGSTPIRWHTFM